MSTETAQEFVYYRLNIGAARNELPTRISEKDCRMYLAVACKNPDRKMRNLQNGYEVHTRYATYTAKPV